MLTDHMALRVRKRQDSKRWIATKLSKRTPAKVFSRFDTNNDGDITISEFRNALRREFKVPAHISDEVFRQWDTDNSGTLEYGEFAKAMHKTVRRDANNVAHPVGSIRGRQSKSVTSIQNRFLSSVARGNQDVSPNEQYIAKTILSLDRGGIRDRRPSRRRPSRRRPSRRHPSRRHPSHRRRR
jgi:hypothetical protein